MISSSFSGANRPSGGFRWYADKDSGNYAYIDSSETNRNAGKEFGASMYSVPDVKNTDQIQSCVCAIYRPYQLRTTDYIPKIYGECRDAVGLRTATHHIRR